MDACLKIGRMQAPFHWEGAYVRASTWGPHPINERGVSLVWLACEDGQVRGYQLPSGEPVTKLAAQAHDLICRRDWLYLAKAKGVLEAYHVGENPPTLTLKWRATLMFGNCIVTSLCLSEDERILAANTHSAIVLVSPESGKLLGTLHHDPYPKRHITRSCFLGPTGSLIARGTSGLSLWFIHVFMRA